MGDFGIASFPDKVARTNTKGKLGPAYFIAPEMIFDPKRVNGGSADVYSLAKTLWVLLCGQKYPLPGELRSDVTLARIETWVQDAGLSDLNGLLEACRSSAPEHRPSVGDL